MGPTVNSLWADIQHWEEWLLGWLLLPDVCSSVSVPLKHSVTGATQTYTFREARGHVFSVLRFPIFLFLHSIACACFSLGKSGWFMEVKVQDHPFSSVQFSEHKFILN